MDTSQPLRLTPSDTLALWNAYQTESMTTHVTRYFFNLAEDKEIREMLEFTLEASIYGMERSRYFLEKANHPLPMSFDENDVNMDAPRLYSDQLVVMLKHKLAQDASVVLSLYLGNTTQTDLVEFYEKSLRDATKIVSWCAKLMQQKGLHHPQLHVPVPEKIEMVKSNSFLGNLFTGSRPLNIAEIFNIVSSFRGTEVLSILFKSFAQIDLPKETKRHFATGAEICDKHLELFQAALTHNDLPKLPTWESEVTDSTVSPFSERLVLFKTALLLAATGGRYGVSLSTVMRKDVGVDFMRMMAEILAFGEDNMKLMIDREYFSQLPMANL